MGHTIEQNAFVLRTPEPITAVRYDGSPEAAGATLALFPDCFARIEEQTADVLVLKFPDEPITVPAGSWVWQADHGYDRAPASVLDDAAFRAAYIAAP